jgi:filamentous hemagglutinin family protein
MTSKNTAKTISRHLGRRRFIAGQGRVSSVFDRCRRALKRAPALLVSVLLLLTQPQMVWAANTSITTTTAAGATTNTNLSLGSGTATITDGTTATATGGTAATINISGGKVSGNNLFHSFDTFHLGTSHTANWDVSAASNKATLANVINRVIGGAGSTIDGKLTMSGYTTNPAFFFINPAGVTFTSGASISLPGAFYVSTANKLYSGTTLVMDTAAGTSTFESATPDKFGFLNAQVGLGDVVINDSTLRRAAYASTAESTHIYARNITFSAQTATREMGIDTLGGYYLAMGNPESGAERYAVIGEQARNSSATGKILVQGSSTGACATTGVCVAQIFGNGMTFVAGTLELLNGGRIRSYYELDTRVYATTVKISGYAGSSPNTDRYSGIVSENNYLTNLKGSSIYIDTDDLYLTNYGSLLAGAVGSNTHSGNIYIESTNNTSGVKHQIRVEDNSSIKTASDPKDNTKTNVGNAGNIVIKNMDDVFVGGSNAEISAKATNSSQVTGQAGDITIAADRLYLGYKQTGNAESTIAVAPGGVVSSESAGLNAGNAGSISLTGKSSVIANDGSISNPHAMSTLAMTDGAQINTSVSAGSASSARAGDITIRAKTIALNTNASITSTTNSKGYAGTIRFDHGQTTSASHSVRIQGGSRVSASTTGAGQAGSILIGQSLAYGELLVAGASKVESYTEYGGSGGERSGNAGEVKMQAESIEIRDANSAVQTYTAGGNKAQSETGDAGAIEIKAHNLQIANSAYAVRSSTDYKGHAGTVSLINSFNSANSSVEIDGAHVSSYQLNWSGNAGTVIVNGFDRVSLKNGGTINSTAGSNTACAATNSLCYATGDAGKVFLIDIGTLYLSGSSTRISSSSSGKGNAGGVFIGADQVFVGYQFNNLSNTFARDSGGIIETSASGYAGADLTNTTINGGYAGKIVIAGRNSNFDESTGTVTTWASANKIKMGNEGRISSSLTNGGKGNITNKANITLDTLSLEMATESADTAASITATTATTGDAGAITIQNTAGNGRIDIQKGSTINASTSADGKAGSITVGGVTSGTAVGTGSTQQFDRISVSGKVSETASAIASVADTNSSGRAGSVTLTTTALTVKDGARVATDNQASTVNAGVRGDIVINAKTVAVGDSQDSNMDANGASISSTSNNSVAAGSIRINNVAGTGAADSVSLDRGGKITTSQTSTTGSGAAGSITIDTKTLAVGSTSTTLENEISSTTAGVAGANAGSVTISNSAAGTTGALTSIAMKGGKISTSTSGAGNATDIVLKAQSLTMDRSEISSSSDATAIGSAGKITIAKSVDGTGATTASLTSLTMTNGSTISTAAKNASSSATAGAITLDTRKLSLSKGSGTNGSQITSSTASSNTAGNITIKASDNVVSPADAADQAITLADGSQISSASKGAGTNAKAGTITIDGNYIDITVSGSGSLPGSTDQQQSAIMATARTGSGGAGSVTVKANRSITVQSGGQISTETASAAGTQVGDITLETARLEVSGKDATNTSKVSKVSSSTQGGVGAGKIWIKGSGTSNQVEVTGGGQIASEATGSATGTAGKVLISNQDSVSVRGTGSKISSSSSASGTSADAGQVVIAARDIYLGVNSDGSTDTSTGNGSGGTIASKSEGAGGAGSVTLLGKTTVAADGTYTDTVANSVTLKNGGAISTSLESATASHNAGKTRGDITLNTANLTLGDVSSSGSITATTKTAGNAGAINIKNTGATAGSVSLANSGSKISSSAQVASDGSSLTGGGTGLAGSVQIGSGGGAGFNTVDINGGEVSAAAGSTAARTDTNTANTYGQVSITAANSMSVREGGKVKTDNAGSGGLSGDGDITVKTNKLAVGGDYSGTGGAFAAGSASGSTISARTGGVSDAGKISISNASGGNLANLDMNQGEISTSATETTSGNAGDINIAATAVALANSSKITSETQSNTAGKKAGTVKLENKNTSATGSSFALSGNSQISSSTYGAAAAGQVQVLNYATASMEGGGLKTVSCDDTVGSGNCSTASGATRGSAGTVVLGADSVSLTNGATIASSSNATGDAGKVYVGGSGTTVSGSTVSTTAVANGVSVTGGSSISTSTTGAATQTGGGTNNAQAGDIAINTTSLTLGQAGDSSVSSITSTTATGGNAGKVGINNAGSALIGLTLNQGKISTSTSGAGSATDIVLKAQSLTMDRSEISSSSDATAIGSAGKITIAKSVDGTGATTGSLTSLTMTNGSTISTAAKNASSSASAGAITVDARKLSLSKGSGTNGSQITSSTASSNTAGNITIKASDNVVSPANAADQAITLADGSQISSASKGAGTNAKAGTITIDGNYIDITVSGSGSLPGSTDQQQSAIMATARTGSGGAGSVTVKANRSITVQSGGQISTETASAAGTQVGDITLETARLEVSGKDATNTSKVSKVSSSTQGGVGAGKIWIKGSGTSNQVEVTGGGQIASEATGSATGTAGKVLISNQDSVSVRGTGSKISSSSSASGTSADAGQVVIAARDIYLGVNSDGSTDTSTGNGSGGTIASKSEGAGGAGSVTLLGKTTVAADGTYTDTVANSVTLKNGGAISTSLESATASHNAGKTRGDITLNTANLTLGDVSSSGSITATTKTAGNAGAINIKNTGATAGSVSLANSGSKISSSAQVASDGSSLTGGGTGLAGSVQIGSGGGAGFNTVDINGGEVSAAAGSTAARTDTNTANTYGQVSITAANSMSVREGGKVKTDNAGSGGLSGDGDITVKTNKLAVGGDYSGTGGAFAAGSASGSTISARTGGVSDAGKISISNASGGNLANLDMNQGEISTSATETTSGNAGDINIAATAVALANSSKITSETQSNTAGKKAGTVKLENKNTSATGSSFALSGNSQISSSTYGAAAAGQVQVLNYATASMEGGGLKTVSCDDTVGSGNCSTASGATRGSAGTVVLGADSVSLTNGATIASSSNATGDAGKVYVGGSGTTVSGSTVSTTAVANGVSVTGGSSISTSTTGAATQTGGGTNNAQAGDIAINTTSLTLGQAGDSSVSSITSTTATGGNAGKVGINNAGSALIGLTLNQGKISTSTSGAGSATDIVLKAQSLTMDGSEISSSTNEGAGQAGNITIDAASSGSGTFTMTNSLVNTSTTGAGAAGSISIGKNAAFSAMTMTGSRRDDTSTGSDSSYSQLLIAADAQNKGIQSTTSGSGNAGTVEIVLAGKLILRDSSISTAALSGATGKAGAITINTRGLDMDPSYISSSDAGDKTSTGGAGAITVNLNGGDLIMAGNRERTAGSGILTSSVHNDAGAITLAGIQTASLKDAMIQTSVSGADGGGGGAINLQAENIYLNSGFIQANTLASGKSGGTITVKNAFMWATANTILDSPTEGYRFVPNVSGFNVLQASSATGSAGRVSIASTLNTTLTQNTQLVSKLLSIKDIVSDYCSIGAGSSLTTLGRGGLRDNFNDFILNDFEGK